jgi:aminoglycoside 6'-N-acetyltransferase
MPSIVTLEAGSFLNAAPGRAATPAASDTAAMWNPVVLRPMTRDDFPALAAWLRAPHVEAWFPWEHGQTPPLDGVETEYGPCIDGTDPTELFVIEAEGRPVGFVQRYRISANPEWLATLRPAIDASAAFGIDYAIGDLDATARRIGSEAIKQLVADTFERYPDADSVVVAVQQANRPSWRALERAGFERRWAGLLDTTDPSDAGPSYVYVRHRA